MYSRTQVIFLLLLSLGISNHVLILPQLLKTSGRDSWISVLVAYVVLLVSGLFFVRISKSIGKEKLYGWLKSRMGIWIAVPLIAVLAVNYFLAGYIALFDMIEVVTIFFLPFTPIWIVTVMFMLFALGASYKGGSTLFQMSAMLLPIVWLLGHFVSAFTFYAKDYGYLLPVLANGAGPVLKGSMIVVGGTTDLLLLLLLQRKLKKPLNYIGLVILITLLCGLVIGPVTGSLAAFGPSVAASLRFPAFEQWRLLIVGKRISHVDFLAILQLMSGSLVRIALMLFLLTDILETKSIRFRRWWTSGVALALVVMILMPISDITMQHFMEFLYFPGLVLFGLAMLLILFIASFIPPGRGMSRNEG